MVTGTKTTEEKIYQVLRDAILNADLPPGQQLKESLLAETFGVSRTPIRTVFQRLKFDSLIELKPKRGAFVYCPSPSEAEQIFEMRQLLEPRAIELAAIHATDIELQKMQHFLEEERILIKDKSFHKSLVATKNFHISIVEASRNLFLIESLRKMITLSHIILTFYDASEHKEANAIDEHAELFEAVQNRQPESAKALAVHHVNSIQNDIDFSKEYSHSVPIAKIVNKYI
ncbi:GntR family transcriptional regulator [Heyndrickxia acidiproducens]|uniref:GntR family transcriptional regulator n=1 Tax=Heyndrickxia acidiproducens TaxID=1121084 RepID=UPI000366EE2A|nr:GntR family transcriptional regulator [Heyndrickxia acidiproducens]